MNAVWTVRSTCFRSVQVQIENIWSTHKLCSGNVPEEQIRRLDVLETYTCALTEMNEDNCIGVFPLCALSHPKHKERIEWPLPQGSNTRDLDVQGRKNAL